MERKLGTFLGVYTPTILTILGVILYLRIGYLVGHMGLGRVLLIVVLANAITAITTLGFSAVATNTRLGAGGAYYIISRSLGIELGGAIGLPLFLSQAFSVTLYAYGLAESLRIAWPTVPVPAAAFGIILVVGVVAHRGAAVALKAQIPLMVLVGASLVVLALGALLRRPEGMATAMEPSGEVTFWAAFAIFFPAVTGIMAGLGLSGDLRDPGRAVPVGAILAVATGAVVYLAVPALLFWGASATSLREDPLVWTRIALLGPFLILPGLWSAIFSSAVGSMLGAPRTLQALSRDGLAPGFLKRGPLPGLIASLAIALGAVFLGNLNSVAVLVSVLFLTVYGTVNIVAAIEALSGDPSWRPKIRVPWPVSLLGGAGCAATILLISPLAGTIAIVTEILLWMLLSRRERAVGWGDARRGLYENLIRWALIRLARRPISARNWRPHVLVFVDDPVREMDLVRFGTWFSHARGVTTVCNLVVGDLLESAIDPVDRRREMQEALDAERLVVFSEVDFVRDLVDGMVDVAQANGMAGISSNTVMLGWPKDLALARDFLRAMRRLEHLNKSLIIGRFRPRSVYPREGVDRTIHIWWGGLQRNGDLMLLLAYLLTLNPAWRGARVQVLSIATTEVMETQTREYLERLIPEIRIAAEPRVIVKPKEMRVAEVIQKESADAEVVFLGLATPEEGKEEEYAERLEGLAGDLQTVFFVKNGSLFVGDLLATGEEE